MWAHILIWTSLKVAFGLLIACCTSLRNFVLHGRCAGAHRRRRARRRERRESDLTSTAETGYETDLEKSDEIIQRSRSISAPKQWGKEKDLKRISRISRVSRISGGRGGGESKHELAGVETEKNSSQIALPLELDAEFIKMQTLLPCTPSAPIQHSPSREKPAKPRLQISSISSPPIKSPTSILDKRSSQFFRLPSPILPPYIPNNPLSTQSQSTTPASSRRQTIADMEKNHSSISISRSSFIQRDGSSQSLRQFSPEMRSFTAPLPNTSNSHPPPPLPASLPTASSFGSLGSASAANRLSQTSFTFPFSSPSLPPPVASPSTHGLGSPSNRLSQISLSGQGQNRLSQVSLTSPTIPQPAATATTSTLGTIIPPPGAHLHSRTPTMTTTGTGAGLHWDLPPPFPQQQSGANPLPTNPSIPPTRHPSSIYLPLSRSASKRAAEVQMHKATLKAVEDEVRELAVEWIARIEGMRREERREKKRERGEEKWREKEREKRREMGRVLGGSSVVPIA